MKKQLLSIFAALTAVTVVAQPSPSWSTIQNASFTITGAGHRFLDAVDNNVVWLSGYDGFDATANYNWYSRTINGGTTYNSGSIFSDTSTYALGNMEGIDANTAWVSAFQRSAPYSIANPGGGVIYRTTNGGASWTNMTAAGMFTNVANSFCNWVSFLTPNDGVVNGDPVGGEFEIWRTTNGGTSWTQVPGANIPNPLANEFCIINLYCKQGTTNLWFGTNAGRIYRSFDAGVTWSVSALSAPSSTITELAFSSPSNGVILSVSGTNRQMYNTTDGGATWNLIHNNLTDPTAAALAIGRNDLCDIPGTGFIASVDNVNGTISYSKNNGVTWNDWGSIGIGYVCIDFANSYRGWAGSFSDANNPSIGGIFKFNGLDFNSSFTVPFNICKSIGDVTITPSNYSSGLAPYTFSWSASSGVAFSSITASVPVITFSANGTYTIFLDVNNPDGTSTSSQVVNVLTCATPAAQFSLSTLNVCNNTVVTLTNSSVGAPNPTVLITTTPASNVTITPGASSTYTLKFQDPGTYVVSMTATNNAGTDTYTQSIVINECRPLLNFTVEPVMCRKVDTVYTNNMSSAVTTSTWSSNPVTGVTLTPITNTANPTITNRKIVFNQAVPDGTTYTLTLKATNSYGTSTFTQTIMVTANNCVGIDEATNLGRNLSIYPNPAKDLVNITLPASYGPVNIRLTNVLGAVIYDEKTTNTKEKTSINLSTQPKGIYFLTVESNNEKVTRKVVVE